MVMILDHQNNYIDEITSIVQKKITGMNNDDAN
jgi:hypothetical protein